MGDTALAFGLADQFAAIEERDSRRENIYAAVDLFSEHNFWSGLTMNMSEGGLFVATHTTVPSGTRLLLHLLLPFEKAPLVVEAEVRWSRPYSGQADVPPGLGLRFVDVDPPTLKKIKKFVATVREPLFYED
ncbi:MAG: Signal recognition particle receptor protein FtsY [Labilithrix sp.]|nr:Signal recognition particle receptor protein FtsY [Labilithrix sp.]